MPDFRASRHTLVPVIRNPGLDGTVRRFLSKLASIASVSLKHVLLSHRGFGTSMIGTPMVIMWSNEGGNITLSQRQASGHIEPTVVAEPKRVASLAQDLSAVCGAKAVYSLARTNKVGWQVSGSVHFTFSVDVSVFSHHSRVCAQFLCRRIAQLHRTSCTHLAAPTQAVLLSMLSSLCTII